MWFIHGWLLNIVIGLISIKLIIVIDVNRKIKEHVENADLFILQFNITSM